MASSSMARRKGLSMRTIGITLAKSNSKGVLNKNFREIAGKPLIDWTIQEAILSNSLEDYIVSTDNEEFLSRKPHLYTAVRRPAELAQDDTPSLDAIKHALDQVDKTYYAVALIPCTTPLRTADDIDNAVQMLEDNPMADSVIGVTECVPVERVKKIEDGLIVDTFPEPQDGQRQNLEKCYVRSGIYVVRRDSLDKLFGHRTSLAYVIPPERAVNIDTMLDWKLAEALLKEREGIA